MKKRKGFTLVEIMIVVAIIALLAAIAIPNLLNARATANKRAAQATVRNIATAVETCAADLGSYAACTTGTSGTMKNYIDEAYYTSTTNKIGNFTTTFTPATTATADYEVKSTDGTCSYTAGPGGRVTATTC